jgi:lipid-A-disaccharide synthase
VPTCTFAFYACSLPQSPRKPALLFTAFEPSGDDHASAVIAELKRRDPTHPIFAWGGPKMHRAGATVIERTGDDAVMGMPGAAKIIEHYRINKRIEAWLKENARSDTPVVAHIPVDSPAANGPICDITKAAGKKVIHLVAPQVWAWGRWRIHKLRRRTDMLLCMLPFEIDFFKQRNVPARFIGHFLFDHAIDTHAVDMRAAAFGDGHPRIAMMPGSRPDELNRHFPILLDAFALLKQKFPGAVGVVAATNDEVANRLRRAGDASAHGWPESLRIVTADTDAVIRWCDIALVKSGTVTLQVAKQHKPMVIFYKKSNPLLFLIARTVLTTRYFALPNLLANRKIIPELIPHYGGPKPIVALAERLITDPLEREAQIAGMQEVINSFGDISASKAAADAIEELTRA